MNDELNNNNNLMSNLDKIRGAVQYQLEPFLKEEGNIKVEDEQVVEQPDQQSEQQQQQPEEVKDNSYYEKLLEEKERELQQLKNPKQTEVKFEELSPLDYIASKWKDVDKDKLKEYLDSEDGRGVKELAEDLVSQLNTAKKELAEISSYPQIQELKYHKQAAELWKENEADWIDELSDVIPEDLKIAGKFGKTKINELDSFVSSEVANFVSNRLKSGKKVSNPLLALSGKIREKIQELDGQVKKTQAPIDNNKKLASISNSSSEQPKKQPMPRNVNQHYNKTMSGILNALNKDLNR